MSNRTGERRIPAASLFPRASCLRSSSSTSDFCCRRRPFKLMQALACDSHICDLHMRGRPVSCPDTWRRRACDDATLVGREAAAVTVLLHDGKKKVSPIAGGGLMCLVHTSYDCSSAMHNVAGWLPSSSASSAASAPLRDRSAFLADCFPSYPSWNPVSPSDCICFLLPFLNVILIR